MNQKKRSAGDYETVTILAMRNIQQICETEPFTVLAKKIINRPSAEGKMLK